MINPDLLSDIEKSEIESADVVKLLDRASRYWLNGEREIAEDVEIAIRLINRVEDFERVLPGASQIVDSFVREAGLYPYLGEEQDLRNDVAREFHRVPGLIDFFFHSEQRRIFSKLIDGENLVLSAPTSFGKTLLVDALIASKQPELVIIVVPTIALLEERRRTLAVRFPEYHILTQSFQELHAEKTIIIGTQERILERHEDLSPNLFVVDEFYKLDLTNGDARARALNTLLAQYIDVAEQVYLLGPSIETNPVDQTERENFEFVRTTYSPVTADVIRVDPPGTDPDTLANLLRDEISGSSLVYCRSPKSTRTVCRELMDRGVVTEDATVQRLADWLRENYHDEWYVADALECGIGIHHGRVPRAVSHLMVQLFNLGLIRVLLCTSSLIEGVNTVAENVVIYDKYISRRKLDRFTYDNIKGRAGRMFQHFVGRVYLFNEPPAATYEALDIPLLKSKDQLSDQAVLQMPETRLSERNQVRRVEILDQVEVPDDILVRYAKFGLEQVEDIYLDVSSRIELGDRSLVWVGVGRYREVLTSVEAIWGRVDFEKHGVRSARQFAFLANKLQRSETIKEFLVNVANGDDTGESLDLAFNFLRGVEYSFFEPLEMLQNIVNAALPADEHCNYSKFLADISSWGLPGNSKALEEVGVPAPIVERVHNVIDTYDIDIGVANIRRLMAEGRMLTNSDIELLECTLL